MQGNKNTKVVHIGNNRSLAQNFNRNHSRFWSRDSTPPINISCPQKILKRLAVLEIVAST